MNITKELVEKWAHEADESAWKAVGGTSRDLRDYTPAYSMHFAQLAAQWGAEQMRERAAKVCIDSWGDSGADWQSACAYLNRAIRALEIT